MKYAVVGLGEFGRSAALGLARKGAEVIAVDIDIDRLNRVKDEVALALRLDATHENALRSHGLDEVDVLIAAIGDNFEAQVLLVVHAKQQNIGKIIARATTPDHIRVLKAVGADEAFNPEEEAARWMVQRLLITNITNYFELAEGFSVVEVHAPQSIVGKTLEQLNLRRRFRLEGDIPATTREDEANYQYLLVERGGVHIEDGVVRLGGGARTASLKKAR